MRNEAYESLSLAAVLNLYCWPAVRLGDDLEWPV